MANRSYLYSFNRDEKGNYSKFFDISEQNYEIPIIYKILVSVNTEVIPSKLFENELALKGDAKEGRKVLNTFFKKLHKVKIFDDDELTDLEKMFQKHLDKYTLDYFLFEPVEVFTMDDENTDKQVKLLASEASDIKKVINQFINETCDDCWSELGIDFSSCLFFTMGNKKEVERIEKQYSIEKLAKVKGLIAKKPTIKRYFTLIKELDVKTDATDVNNAIDEILKLNPNYGELWDCAYYYQDLDKKIALFKQIKKDYPKEEKTKDIDYWISRAYEEKEEYDLALKYRIQDVINDPDANPYLDALIKYGNFNRQKIYQDLATKIKNRYVEKVLIDIEIENKNYDIALEKYYSLDKEWQKMYEYNIVWDFLRENQLTYAMELMEKFNTHSVLYTYYKDKKQYDKAVYYFFKYKYNENPNIDGLVSDFIDENVDINKLIEENIIPNVDEFEPKIVIKIANEFDEYIEKYSSYLPDNYLSGIAKKLLEAVIPICKKEKDKEEAYSLLTDLTVSKKK